jgi:polyisoprenoid-binding protein YceI
MLSSKQCSAYALVPGESQLRIEAHSTLPKPIRGTAAGLNGTFSANVEDGRLSLDPMPSLNIVVPVAKLSSGNEFQDREIRKLIGSLRHPNLVGELRRVGPGPSPDVYRVHGAITIMGVTQEYDGEVTIRVDGRRVSIVGSQRMDIRRFGITPPRILTIQIYPDFDVSLQLVAELAA